MAEAFFSDASKQWQSLLQQASGPWADLMRMGGQQGKAFEQWSALFEGTRATPAESIERFVQGARDYIAFLQNAVGAASANAEGMSAWTQPLKQMFAGIGGGALPLENPFMQIWPASLAVANPFAANLQMPAPNLQPFKDLLALPAFGLAREHQVSQQQAGLAWVEYQEQIGRHNEQMLKAVRRGFELFEGKLAEREQPGRQIETLRALYDLWVDAIEEGYAEVALSQEYREVYGALVNAQMRVRSHLQKEVERLSSDLGVPTRSEIDSLGERLQALRREVRAARGGDAVIDQIAELRAELESLARNVVRDALGARKAPSTAREQAAREPGKPAAPARRSAAAKPARPARGRGKKKTAAKRATAATATGGFASRIARFADASLGTKRKPAPATTAPARGKRGNKP